MSNPRFMLFASILFSFATRAALAGDDHNPPGNQVGAAVGVYAWDLAQFDRSGNPSMVKDDPARCTEAIDKHKGELADDDLIKDAKLKSWPGAVKDAHSAAYTLPYGKAHEICDAYAEKKQLIEQFAVLVADYKKLPHLDVDDYSRTMGLPDGKDAAADKCLADVEAAASAGVPRDVTMPFGDKKLNLDQLKAVCQVNKDETAKAAAAIQAKIAAENAEIEAVYKKAGIKGDRLKLFAGEGLPEHAGFLLPGCDRAADTAAAMKKAKKLFQWAEGDQGITVTRYVFKGDKFTVSSRTFDRKESAYAWCK